MEPHTLKTLSLQALLGAPVGEDVQLPVGRLRRSKIYVGYFKGLGFRVGCLGRSKICT